MAVCNRAQSLDILLPTLLPEVTQPGFHTWTMLQVETKDGSTEVGDLGLRAQLLGILLARSVSVSEILILPRERWGTPLATCPPGQAAGRVKRREMNQGPHPKALALSLCARLHLQHSLPFSLLWKKARSGTVQKSVWWRWRQHLSAPQSGGSKNSCANPPSPVVEIIGLCPSLVRRECSGWLCWRHMETRVTGLWMALSMPVTESSQWCLFLPPNRARFVLTAWKQSLLLSPTGTWSPMLTPLYFLVNSNR